MSGHVPYEINIHLIFNRKEYIDALNEGKRPIDERMKAKGFKLWQETDIWIEKDKETNEVMYHVICGSFKDWKFMEWEKGYVKR